MRGGFWVFSYVVLFVVVLANIALSLTIARQVGRVLRVSAEDPETRGADPAGPGVKPGDALGMVEVVDVASGIAVRPSEWSQSIILQTVLFEAQDVERLRALRDALPSLLRQSTVVSLNVGPEELIPLAETLAPLKVTSDQSHRLEAALRTKVRPYIVATEYGKVIAARDLQDTEDLRSFLLTAFGIDVTHVA